MKDYIIVTVAVMLLAVNFVIQKQYQRKAGTAIFTSLFFNAFTGFFSAIIIFIINGFRLSVSPFSVLMATLSSSASLLYTMLGFRILKKGNMSLYTLFLMTGGMIVPYIWGILFLEEAATPLRIVGLLIITAAVFLSNKITEKSDKSQLLLCAGVFLLNGIVSVVSKMHQIDTVHNPVGATDFVVLSGIVKFVLCSTSLLIMKTGKIIQAPQLQYKSLLPLIALGSAMSGISYVLQLISAGNLPASVLYPLITGGSIIFTAIAGRLVFAEKPSTRQLAAIIICFIGTCMFL